MSVVKIRNDADDAWIVVGGGVSVTQSAGAPATTYPGMLWVDTDADNPGNSIIEDDDNDTKIQCEESADEDTIRIDVGGHESVVVYSTGTIIYGAEEAEATLILAADLGTDNADWWKLRSEPTSNDFAIQTKQSGSYADVIHATLAGEVTKPLQPAFLVTATNQSNLVAGGSRDIQFDQEVTDQGGDFAVGTYTFTAPVTGNYQLNAVVRLNTVDTSASYYQINIVTSNRTYTVSLDPNFTADLGDPGITVTLPVLVDMDANDTAKVTFYQSGGGNVTDTTGSVCVFSGCLSC